MILSPAGDLTISIGGDAPAIWRWGNQHSHPFFPLWMRGDSSMSPSIDMSREHGKGVHCFSHAHLYDTCMSPLTIHMQEKAPRRSIHFSRPHGLVRAVSMANGHYLGGLGEDRYHGGHDQISASIIYLPRACEEIHATNWWLSSHNFYQSLW